MFSVYIYTNLEGINHINRLAWEITLYPKAVPRSYVLGETAFIHLLLAVVLPSVPLPRAGTSTGCTNIISASPSPHPQENSPETSQELLGIREGVF